MADFDLLHLTLIRAPTDPETFSPAYQAELMRLLQQLQASGLEISARPFMPHGGGGLVGEFLIPLAQLGGPLISAVEGVEAWMAGCVGRQLRLTVGAVELAASSPADLTRILHKALELKAAHLAQGPKE